MIWLVMAGLFAVGAATAQIIWRRRQLTWARVTAPICLLGLIIITIASTGLFDRFFPQTLQGPAAEVPSDQVAHDLAAALQAFLPPHAQIIVFRPDVPGCVAHEDAWRQAITSALGPSVQILAITSPSLEGGQARLTFSGRADAFSKVLDKYPQLDAWISLTGLPVDLPGVSTFKRKPAPLVGAYVGSVPINPRELGRSLKSGRVTVIITADDQNHLTTYTHDNYADLMNAPRWH